MSIFTRNKLAALVILIFLSLLSTRTVAVVAYSKDEIEQPQQCQSKSEEACLSIPPPPLQTKKILLYINAANGRLNWGHVNYLAGNKSGWEVQELILDNFGPIMRDVSFTAALEKSFHTLKQALEDIQPDVLLVSSKGVGVVAYLASKKLWADRPVVLFSSIPNPIDGLVSGDSYGLEWSDTIGIFTKHRLGQILVVAGSSSDEEMLVSQALEEPSACGEISQKTGSFEKCTDWRHVVVPGDHNWNHLHENESIVSNLITYMMSWLESRK